MGCLLMIATNWRIVFGAIVLTLSGCGSKPAETIAGRQPTATVAVLVAASAQNAVGELAERFKADAGVDVRVVADDSAKLAQQIANGAPADLFLSASPKWTKHLDEKGLVARQTPLLGNRLVLIVPAGNPAGVSGPEDLLSPKVTHLALAGPNVPAGMYARQALGKLGLLEKLEQQHKIVSGENVRVTLAYAERGEVEAAVVYSTDARISKKVKEVFVFPESLHDAIEYPLALIKPTSGGEPPAAASRLYDYLQQPLAAEVFQQHGFQWLGSPSNDGK
jgi:molybdate transport system substrate-binding protein